MRSSGKHRWLVPVAVLVFLAASVLPIYFFFIATPTEVAYNEFLNQVRAGRVQEVQIGERQLFALLKPAPEHPPSQENRIAIRRLPGVDLSGLLKELESQNVMFLALPDRSAWKNAAALLILLVLLVSVYGYVIWRNQRGMGRTLLLGKSQARIYDQSNDTRVTFGDVAGVDESKAELVEIVDFLRNPERYQKLGGRIPKGVLLVGPPGTGKTLLAKAVAGEAGVPFFSISASEFIEMFVGVGAARVRSLFDRAKRKAPCIIFIDELDAIGKSRADRRQSGSHDEREQTLNQLLVEMDGFDPSKGVIIMAATNTPEVLDPALVRTGRFDRQVLIDRPDLQGREAVLRVHARHVQFDEGINFKTIAARTPGMVGADLANIINEAALLAARRNAERVGMKDLEEAIDRVMLGLEKKSRVMTEQEKERVSYHETGHALVALSVEHADPVHRVSIIPRSIGALGHVLQLPTQEKFLMTKPEIEDRLAVMLGGRAAEEIIYGGIVSTGGSNDLEKVSELARQMVTHFGMSDVLGPLTYGSPLTPSFLPSSWRPESRNYSERTAETIDQEARRIVDETYERVQTILMKRRPELERIARELMRKETLNTDELFLLMSASHEVLQDES
jgi:cell division protease FtsH